MRRVEIALRSVPPGLLGLGGRPIRRPRPVYRVTRVAGAEAPRRSGSSVARPKPILATKPGSGGPSRRGVMPPLITPWREINGYRVTRYAYPSAVRWLVETPWGVKYFASRPPFFESREWAAAYRIFNWFGGAGRRARWEVIGGELEPVIYVPRALLDEVLKGASLDEVKAQLGRWGYTLKLV